MKAVLIPAGNEPMQDIDLPNNGDQAFTAVRMMVDGYVEAIKVRGYKAVLWTNEDGKMMGLPKNLRATFLSVVAPPDFIVGPAIMTGGVGALRLDCPLTAQQVQALLDPEGKVA
jgi:hypothetical protein